MNKRSILLVALAVVVLGVLVSVFGKGIAEAPTEETPAERKDHKEVGAIFLDNFLAIAPPAEDSDAQGKLESVLSSSALAEIDEDNFSRDVALFVGVQDIPDEGYEVLDDAENESDAYMKVRFNYSGGPVLKRIEMVEEDGVWKVDSVSDVNESEEEQRESNFKETGNLVINNPGYPEDVWYLVYEKPGEAGLNEALIFTEGSLCVSESEEEVCDTDMLESGMRVEVEGFKVDDGVEVEVLHQI
ncbi:MAG: hypothetical protein ACQEP6_03540 [Patescibacteria group bacterium]